MTKSCFFNLIYFVQIFFQELAKIKLIGCVICMFWWVGFVWIAGKENLIRLSPDAVGRLLGREEGGPSQGGGTVPRLTKFT